MSTRVKTLKYVELVCDECAAVFEDEEYVLYAEPWEVREVASNSCEWTHDRDDGRDLCVDCAYPTTAVREAVQP